MGLVGAWWRGALDLGRPPAGSLFVVVLAGSDAWNGSRLEESSRKAVSPSRRRTSRCTTRTECKQKERGLIGLLWAHGIRSARRESGSRDRVRCQVERGRDPEAIGLGRRNAPVGCPPGRHRVSWQRRLGQVEGPQGASGLSALLLEAEMPCNGRSPVGDLTRSRVGRLGGGSFLESAVTSSGGVREKILGVPQDRRRSCARQRDDATEGHPSEIVEVVGEHGGQVAKRRRLVSKSLRLSKVAPRPTW